MYLHIVICPCTILPVWAWALALYFCLPVGGLIVTKVASYQYIDGLAQDCSISIANTLEILQSCTKPSILTLWWEFLYLRRQPLHRNRAQDCIISVDTGTGTSFSFAVWDLSLVRGSILTAQYMFTFSKDTEYFSLGDTEYYFLGDTECYFLGDNIEYNHLGEGAF